MGNNQTAHRKIQRATGTLAKAPEYDFSIKILILGDTNSGRRTLRQAIIEKCCISIKPDSDRNDDHIDGDFSLLDGQIARIQLVRAWKRMNTFDDSNSFFRGAQAFLICYSIKDYETFDNAFKWHQQLLRYSRFEDPPTFMVATQLDCASERHVANDQATDRCQSQNLPFFEVSGLTGEGVADMFNKFVEAIGKYHRFDEN